MLQVIGASESQGYSAVHEEFEYQLVTMCDPGVCSVCAGLSGMLISGAFIHRHFPYAVQYSATEWFAHVHPHCRCILKMTNPYAACANLLHNDLTTVT
jgi:hypothetical protein